MSIFGDKEKRRLLVLRKAPSIWGYKRAKFIPGLGEEMLSGKMAIVFFLTSKNWTV